MCRPYPLADLKFAERFIPMTQLYPLIPEHLVRLLGGPEKAGVGGSIPSLATI